MTDVNRQLVKAFRDTVASWELDLSEAGYLIGIEEATVREFLSAEAIDVSEDVVARIVMVAQIRTALDLCWSPSLSRQWMKLPNGGDPYNGISPLEYVKGHGWPALFWILRQVQAWAVGNFQGVLYLSECT